MQTSIHLLTLYPGQDLQGRGDEGGAGGGWMQRQFLTGHTHTCIHTHTQTCTIAYNMRQ